MTQIRRSIITIAALLLLFAPLAASAREGESGSGSGSSGSGSGEVGVASSSPMPSPNASPEPEDRRNHAEAELRDQLEHMKDERKDAVQSALAEKKTDLKQRLDDAKKKACENHQATINKLMDTMDDRRQAAFKRITQVSEAAQAFYAKKGVSVSNYSDLVAAVNAAKAAAQTAMLAQQAIPKLNCDGDHPRADITDFKEKRGDSIDAMKVYRQAVKELVKAIKAAVENTHTTEAKS